MGTTSEASIERKIVAFAQKNGWKVFKFVSPGNSGVADRLLVREGVVLFLEIKRPGEEPKPLQYKFLRDMRKQRVFAFWADSLADVKSILERYGLLDDPNSRNSSSWFVTEKHALKA
jgi:hypothetical protein